MGSTESGPLAPARRSQATPPFPVLGRKVALHRIGGQLVGAAHLGVAILRSGCSAAVSITRRTGFQAKFVQVVVRHVQERGRYATGEFIAGEVEHRQDRANRPIQPGSNR